MTLLVRHIDNLLHAEVAGRIPGAIEKTVAGAGHMFIHERPDEFAGIVADFLGS